MCLKQKNNLSFKKTLSIILCFLTLFCFFSCGSKETSVEEYYSPYEFDFGKTVLAEVTVKDFGNFTLTLFPDEAPETVENFVFLVNSGFYNGLLIHRIVPDLLIQGGDPAGNGFGDINQKTVVGEFYTNGRQNRISHVTGVISMARRNGQNNSATSQFFIMCADKEQKGYLNGNYAAFGCVTSGMDVVKRISSVDIDQSTSRPLSDVIIEEIQIIQ